MAFPWQGNHRHSSPVNLSRSFPRAYVASRGLGPGDRRSVHISRGNFLAPRSWEVLRDLDISRYPSPTFHLGPGTLRQTFSLGYSCMELFSHPLTLLTLCTVTCFIDYGMVRCLIDHSVAILAQTSLDQASRVREKRDNASRV